MPGELTQASTLWFKEEVRQIRKDVLKQDLPDLETFSMFDIEIDVEPGSQEFGSDMITQFGEMTVVANASDNIQFAEVGIYRNVHKVIALAIAYKWTYPEVMQAMAVRDSTKIPRRLRGKAARDIALQELAEIGFNGKPQYGVYGFTNYPGIPQHQMSTNLADADDAQDIVDDLMDLSVRPIKATKNQRKPDHMGVGLDKYLDLAARDRHATKSTDKTIIGWFQEQISRIVGKPMNIFPSWRFDVLNKLAVWKRGETANAKLVIPGNMRFLQLPMQVSNLDYKVPCLSMSGGWYTEYPLATCFGRLKG